MNYYYKKETALLFADAIEKTKEALANEGFGILTEIDVKATLKKNAIKFATIYLANTTKLRK